MPFRKSSVRIGLTADPEFGKNKLGKYNAEEMAKIAEEKAALEREEEEAAQKMKVGDRCQVRVPDKPTRRGEVKFVGKVHYKPGTA